MNQSIDRASLCYRVLIGCRKSRGELRGSRARRSVEQGGSVCVWCPGEPDKNPLDGRRSQQKPVRRGGFSEQESMDPSDEIETGCEGKGPLGFGRLPCDVVRADPKGTRRRRKRWLPKEGVCCIEKQ